MTGMSIDEGQLRIHHHNYPLLTCLEKWLGSEEENDMKQFDGEEVSLQRKASFVIHCQHNCMSLLLPSSF